MYILGLIEAPVDEVEHWVVNGFSKLQSIFAVWRRFVPARPGQSDPTYCFWLQIDGWAPGDLEKCDRMIQELGQRILHKPYNVAIDRTWEPPPVGLGAVQIYRRTAATEAQACHQ